MRRFVLILAVALTATGIAAPATAAAGTGRTEAKSERAKVKHYCSSLDEFIRFLRKAPKPSKFDSSRGRRVLRELAKDSPAHLGPATALVRKSFTSMAEHGRRSLTPRQHRATNAAMFKVAVFGATRCEQRLVRGFGSAMVRARIEAAERESSTTTKP